jgi:phosphohistidine phosphatase
MPTSRPRAPEPPAPLGWRRARGRRTLDVVWIHLLRHGIAIDPTDPASPTDPERFLTDKGIARTRAAARGIALLGIETPELVLSSPYVRAKQTADIAVEALALGDVPRRESDALVPVADPAAIVAELKDAGTKSVLCVGHAPNLDLVIATLVGSDEAITSLKKAGFCSLVVPRGTVGPGTAQIVAVYPASVLRKLGGDVD